MRPHSIARLERIKDQMADLQDFTGLVQQHQNMVYSIALHTLRNSAVAEDLSQEVFLSLHQHLHELQSADHVRNWLRRTVANRCIDEIRRQKYRRGPALEDIKEPSVREKEGDPFLSAQLRELVAGLPALARVMTVMRFQEELEPREIAAQLNLPVATVKSRLHRTLKLLRGRLQVRSKA